MLHGDSNLAVTTTNNEDNPLMHGVALMKGLPVLALDLWEHSYFLKYHTDVGAYVDNFWKVVDWDRLSQEFEESTLQGKVANPF